MSKLGRKVRVQKVTPRAAFRMQITFDDGTVKEIDLSPYLRGPIFEPVRSDPAVFRDAAH